LTGPHSTFGQQLTGSTATTLAHGQRTAGQVLAVRSHVVGQVVISQHVFGSTLPVDRGGDPSGQSAAIVGQATGFIGSHLGCSGTQRPTHSWPLQLPAASHMQLGSDAGQVQVVSPGARSGGSGVPAPVVGFVVVGVPPELQPQPEQLTSQTWPLGQSVLARQPVWMFGTQTP
jgi:hypothetical protein